MIKLSKARKHIDKNKRFYTGVAALTLSAAADVGLTAFSIDKHGIEIEGNPLLKNAIEYWGINIGLIGTKTFGTIGITAIAKKYYDNLEKITSDVFLYTGTAVWSIASLSHISLILKPELF